MDGLKTIIADLAIVGLIAAFLDMLLPDGSSKNGVKLVFGLYFIAILLNPVLGFFNDNPLSDLDFRDLAVEIPIETQELSEDDILKNAQDSLGQEIETKCGALYEEGHFQVTVALSQEEITDVTVKCSGVSSGKERVVSADIKEFVAKDYGVKKSKVKVVF